MNKTLLLMLIDFLLLHIIHDSPWDKLDKKTAHQGGATQTFARHMDQMNFVRLRLKQEQAENQQLVGSLQAAKDEQADTQDKLDATKGNLKDTKKELENRVVALKDANERAQQQTDIIEQKNTEIEDRDKEINDRDKTIQDNKDTIAKRDATIKQIDIKINNLAKERDDLQGDKEGLETEKKELTAKVDDLTKKNTKLEKDNTQLTTTNKGLESDKNTLVTNYRASTDKIVALNGQLQAATTTVNQLRNDKAKLDATAKNLAGKNVDLNKNLAAATTKVNTLGTQLSDEKTRTQKLSNDVASKDAQLVSVREQKAETEKSLAVAQKERDVAAQTVNQVVKANEDLRNNIQRVADLAAKNANLALREARNLAAKQARDPAELYNEYVANHVTVNMELNGAGGIVYRDNKPVRAPKDLKGISRPVLVQGSNYLYAIAHSSQTPFDLSMAGLSWKTAKGAFNKGAKSVPVHWLGFLKNDPRVVAIPLHPNSKNILNIQKVYKLSKTPKNHAEAVVVREGKNYGRVLFQVIPGQSNHVKVVKQNIIEKLANPRFQPRKGDVVLSRTGELLGVMVNDSYCLTISEQDINQKSPFVDWIELKRQDHISGLGNKLKTLANLIKRKPSDLH